ncbi:DUF58 domain-containing protein [Candidatus Woesearchaeota archaeon]|nr:DUF58 domain-containing protein [Candidatus Woesearchaeota archaeon]
MKRLNIDLKIGFESLNISARDIVTTQFLGNYKSVFRGRGLEFDSYRQYYQDDDASSIDWKASARANTLLVKQYVEERNLNVFFLIDVSNTMILSSQPKLKCEYAAEIVSSLSYTILRSGDNVGYALFNDKIVNYAPPVKGLNVHQQLIDVLTQSSNYGGEYNLSKAITFAAENLSKGTIVIIVSDFIGTIDSDSFRLLADKFSVLGMMVRDPIDRSIPEGMGQLAVADPFSNDTMLVDPNILKPYYEEEVKKNEEYVRSLFMENGSDFIILQTDSDFIGKIIELFRMRQMKWR